MEKKKTHPEAMRPHYIDAGDQKLPPPSFWSSLIEERRRSQQPSKGANVNIELYRKAWKKMRKAKCIALIKKILSFFKIKKGESDGRL